MRCRQIDPAQRRTQSSLRCGGLGQTLRRTENEVATHILVREVYAMVERRFHETRIPAPEGEGG
jgi:hypothetical protein